MKDPYRIPLAKQGNIMNFMHVDSEITENNKLTKKRKDKYQIIEYGSVILQ
jgi:hypothetical protein